MIEFDKLQRIPLWEYNEFNYEAAKNCNINSMNEYMNSTAVSCTPIEAVCTHFHEIDDDMQEDGMEKFVAMISGMLFQIKRKYVDSDLAETIAIDIGDFDTGEYDYLFTESDLKHIKDDVKTIKSYLRNHLELLDGLSEYQEFRREKALRFLNEPEE